MKIPVRSALYRDLHFFRGYSAERNACPGVRIPLIEAKDYKRPGDVKMVGAFKEMVQDVRAQKGILICNAGFTKNAKEYAKSCKIDVLSAHDASKVKWQTKIEVPVIKKSVIIKLRIGHMYIPNYELTLRELSMPDPSAAIAEFIRQWEEDELPKTEGEHVVSFDNKLIEMKDQAMFKLKSEFRYEVNHRYHFKYFQPSDYRGVKDYISNNFRPSFIEFNETIPFLNDGTWKYVSDISEVSIDANYLDIELINIDLGKFKRMKIQFK